MLASWILLYGVPGLLLGLAVWTVVSLLQRRWRYQELLSSFPGPKPHWWYGNAQQISGDYNGLLRTVACGKQYGGIFPVWGGPFDVTLLSLEPDSVKAVLAGTVPKDEYSYSMLAPWLGRGLLLQSGKRWDRNRRLFTPAFHVEVLKTYMDVFTVTVNELVSKWKKLGHPAEVEVFHHASLLTMDSMLRCLFGHVSHCQEESRRHPYIQRVYEVSELIVKRTAKPYLMVGFIYSLTENGKRFKKACDEIHAYSQQIIKDRKKLLQSEKLGSRDIDFLDVLLTAKDSDGQGLSDQEIQDEVDTFMFAGHDSTASSLSWCLYNLAAHPNSQEACRKEANKVLGGKSKYDWDDLKKMETISACIQESMRLYPAVPTISRYTEKEIALPDGRRIPKGIRVGVSLFSLQRDPELWDNPEVYDPSRFLSSGNDAYSGIYMPFSTGPRNCIGKSFAQIQLKINVATIVSNFKLTLVPDKPPIPECRLIIRSKNGLYLSIVPLK